MFLNQLGTGGAELCTNEDVKEHNGRKSPNMIFENPILSTGSPLSFSLSTRLHIGAYSIFIYTQVALWCIERPSVQLAVLSNSMPRMAALENISDYQIYVIPNAQDVSNLFDIYIYIYTYSIQIYITSQNYMSSMICCPFMSILYLHYLHIHTYCIHIISTYCWTYCDILLYLYTDLVNHPGIFNLYNIYV